MPSNTIEATTIGVADPGELSATSVTVKIYDELAADHCNEPVKRGVLAADATPAMEWYDALTPKDTASDEACLGAGTANDADQLDPQITAESLAEQLSHLVNSVAVVEELSRHAREAAANDLTRYEAVIAAAQQYGSRLDQAQSIRDQAQHVLEGAFGHAARAAAEPLVAEAERVLAEFTQLVGAWKEQADGFLAVHPDVELLLAEQLAQEQAAREREAQAARLRRHEALIASVDAALEQRVFAEVRRGLAAFEREFPEDSASLLARQRRLDQLIRFEHDEAAREAMQLAADQQALGDLEGAVNTLEHVDVHALSLEVSQDVFGRWSDACSRLAQTTGAQLVRYAPSQGRGFILLVDPSRPDELQVFSALGMGPNYPCGTVITSVIEERERRTPEALARARERARLARTVLERARGFREATPAAATSWGFPSAAESAGPIHH